MAGAGTRRYGSGRKRGVSPQGMGRAASAAWFPGFRVRQAGFLGHRLLETARKMPAMGQLLRKRTVFRENHVQNSRKTHKTALTTFKSMIFYNSVAR